MSWAAIPFVQVVSPSSSLANTCSAGSATSTVIANVDVPAGASYRYEVAFLFFPTMDMNDMDMMMMMMGGSDMPDPYYALLYQSPAINGPTVSAGAVVHDGARGGRPYDDHGARNNVHGSQRQRSRGCLVSADLGLHDRSSARHVECGQCRRGKPFPCARAGSGGRIL
jgi:hypothetical protein